MAAKGSGLTRNDPRSTSQESLVPAVGEQSERRKLLLVYIHGFMGNETSFRSFPAHVHSILAVLLAETHVVHTKIYPRYRSRGNITVARDSFSDWIEPHQDPLTDVVLLGHSMGGLLCAEIVLMPPSHQASRALNHLILGTINFDVPFLGMHPGVVKSGLASLFSPAEEPRDAVPESSSPVPVGDGGPGGGVGPAIAAAPSRADTFWSGGMTDPNYNPHFGNDTVLPVRKGWQSAWHFITKHSDDLTGGVKKLVTSHLEFGGAMANYSELKTRYARIRALEEEDERIRQSVVEGGIPPRVRFINYYTASTGRPKKPTTPSRKTSDIAGDREQSRRPSTDIPDLALSGEDCAGGSEVDDARLDTKMRSPSTSSSRNSKQGTGASDAKVARSPSPVGMMSLSPRPEPEDPEEDFDDAMETLTIGDTNMSSASAHDVIVPSSSSVDSPSVASSMPVDLEGLLPPLPAAPPPLDVSFITDKGTRKLVEKEHAKAVKNYEKAVKNRAKLIEDHKKATEKQARKDQKAISIAQRKESEAKKKSDADMTHNEREALRMEQERKRMEAESRRLRGEKSPTREDTPESDTRPSMETREPSSVTVSTMHTANEEDTNSLAPQNSKKEDDKTPPKDRMFCTLPPKDSNGERDPCWLRVFMKNVDEVGAHCGLFFVDERYEKLVGDVAERIEGWVKEDINLRLLQTMRA
ncbi:uncharacterized protein RCC_02425 [Ramularia collo-cygni]|uniref:AB hydrolase-1 domain-containing protein n=1 Tax=Ramularia collo-cygni TaxID=112498 RepID=A0A2D3UNP2_9PEZI|nr:uncharacterized protein RCC_02425 [Ramularia collo-cygni]CZT16591.1 uncharacterized protein RCC_02425 [Ramularia collo-cygni]